MKNFIEELKCRGLIQDVVPGTEEFLNENNNAVAYLGIDPTADSLHIGHLASIVVLKLFQMCGGKPIVLVGGATGMVGDPSGKSAERNLLTEDILKHNKECIKNQLSKLIDFESTVSRYPSAILVDNYDWMKNYSFINFIRDIGKHLTVNYMMAKDSVKKRLASDTREGMSFTEFSYQLLQGYDFLHLWENYGCKVQLGGADQWGNITTGVELIRRTSVGKDVDTKVYGLTFPLVTKSDGTKFGKTEKGNIWLDPNKTTPYEFYQFWYNVSDEDAERYIKIFTLLPIPYIEEKIALHREFPEGRLLQKILAEHVTIMIHGLAGLKAAGITSTVLFNKETTKEFVEKLTDDEISSVISSIPSFDFTIDNVLTGDTTLIDALTIKTDCFKSRTEVRRAIKEGSLYLNWNKVTNENYILSNKDLVKNRYIFVRRGKKDWYVLG